MNSKTARKFLRLVLVPAILGCIKLHSPHITYFELLKAAPAAYTVVDKLTSEKEDQTKQ